MKIVEIFQANNVNIICVDRKLTWQERVKRTAKIENVVVSVNGTTNDRWLSTKDEIQDPKALTGKEIELM